MSEPLWSVRDVAEWAGITYNAAYKALKRLKLAHAEYGRAGALLYHPDEVRAAWPLLPGSGAWKRDQGKQEPPSGDATP